MRWRWLRWGGAKRVGGRVNSVVLARQASTGELLSPRHVHKPSKHKPGHFLLLNPEEILRPDPLSCNSIPVRILTKRCKAGGSFFFSLSLPSCFQGHFFMPSCPYFSLSPPKPQTPPANTTREAVTVQESTSVVPNFQSRGFQEDLD